MITLPDDASAAQIRAVTVNEASLTVVPSKTIILVKPLQLVSPAYIAERNEAELSLEQSIADLRTENARLKDK